MHFCEEHSEVSYAECCLFVQLLNNTSRIPHCNASSSYSDKRPTDTVNTPLSNATIILWSNFKSNISNSELRLGEVSNPRNNTSTNSSASSLLQTIIDKQNQQIRSTPEYLKIPSETPEDHVTFMFGIFLLISVAVLCTMFIMKMTKPKITHFPYTLRSGGRSIFDYDILLWLPNAGCASSLASGIAPIYQQCRNRHQSYRRHHQRQQSSNNSGCTSISNESECQIQNKSIAPIIDIKRRNKNYTQQPSLVLLLRSVVPCRSGITPRSTGGRHTQRATGSTSHNSLSTISTNTTNLNLNALPTYHQAMTPSSSFTVTSSASYTLSGQPPSYDELERLTHDKMTHVTEIS